MDVNDCTIIYLESANNQDDGRAFTVGDKRSVNKSLILISNTGQFRCISLHQSVNYKH